jgi:FkbM family methyltransferase
VKKLAKKFVGDSAWFFLGKAKREYRLKSQQVHMDTQLYKILSPLLPKNGRYVDIGAHDGRTSSNTWHLEKMGWIGVLVEPIPWRYFDLKRLRSGQNFIVNAACVPDSLSGTPIEIHYGDLMTTAPQISTLDQSDWSNGAKDFMHPFEDQVTFWVKGQTVNQILQSANMGNIFDFLSIDVEGSEFAVLSGINFQKYKFKVICVEAYVVEEVEKFLVSNGYQIVANTSNNLIAVPIRN